MVIGNKDDCGLQYFFFFFLQEKTSRFGFSLMEMTLGGRVFCSGGRQSQGRRAGAAAIAVL